MIKPNRQFRQFVVVFLMLFSLTAVLPVAATAQGNNDAAHLCQKGGWEDLQGMDGTRFANQGECVSYAAQGNQLRAATYIFLEKYTVGDYWCGVEASQVNYPVGQYYLEMSGGKQPFGSYVWVHQYAEGVPTTFVAHYWRPDGITYTVTANLYNVERSQLLSSDTLEIQC